MRVSRYDVEASGNDEPPCGPLTPWSRILVLRSPETLQSSKAQGTPPEKTRVQNFCGNFLVASAGLFFWLRRRAKGGRGDRVEIQPNAGKYNHRVEYRYRYRLSISPKTVIVAASIMTLVVLELRGLR